MRKFPAFVVTVNAIGKAWIANEQFVEVNYLPHLVANKLSRQGKYLVKRVHKCKHAVPVGVAPSDNDRLPALYVERNSLKNGKAMLCRGLCNLLGYSAKKTETLYVSIKRIEK